MKQCIQCGRQRPDAANFCPGCGAMQSAEGPKTDKWGVPQPAEGSRSAPPANEWRTASDPAPAADGLWAMPPVPEMPKKKGFKARYVILPLLLAVLAAAGVFAYRVLKAPSEIRYYDDDGELSTIEYYDGRGFPERSVGYQDDEESWKETYKSTSEAKKVDTDAVEHMDGVTKVEAVVYFFEPVDGERSEDIVIVGGYNRLGEIVAQQSFVKINGEYVLLETREYEMDVLGHQSKCTVTSPDGDVICEWEMDNEYSFGRLVRSEVSLVADGYLTSTDKDGVEVEWHDEPVERERVKEYEY